MPIHYASLSGDVSIVNMCSFNSQFINSKTNNIYIYSLDVDLLRWPQLVEKLKL